ncbi:MAG: FAD-dependent oxidoreductase [Syntrophotaleaceae bacterium]
MTGSEHLYFYDAIAPIVEAESIDFSIAWRASRYGRGGDDYVQLPSRPRPVHGLCSRP